MRGLASVPGRKSVRRMSEHVLGRRADQALQQFVNQSSWDWAPVRRQLADRVTAALGPQAWIVEEATVPKHGSNSVAVERQFSHSAGRVINCQLALVVMASGTEGCAPLNWRLLLPPSWDGDTKRRARVRLPEHEKHRSRSQYLLDALDEMMIDWKMRPMPVVMDARQHALVEPLIRGLEARGLRYALRADPRTPVAKSSSDLMLTAGECLVRSGASGGLTIPGQDGRVSRPRYVAALLPHSPASSGPSAVRRRTRKVVAEWTPDARGPESVWITNLETARPSALFDLIALRRKAGQALEQLSEDSGLRHFEGRSFQGWHHHATLVSAAHAYGLLQRMAG